MVHDGFCVCGFCLAASDGGGEFGIEEVAARGCFGWCFTQTPGTLAEDGVEKVDGGGGADAAEGGEYNG